MNEILELLYMVPLVFLLIIFLKFADIDVFNILRGVFTTKKWKVKEEGGFFGVTRSFFDTQKEADQYMKDHLPRGGIFSQAIHHKLFHRIGLRWKLVGCYIRDTNYTKDENGEDVAEPLENIVLACQHVKDHLAQLDKEGKRTCNAMFGIRAEWLHMFCKKGCEISAFNK